MYHRKDHKLRIQRGKSARLVCIEGVDVVPVSACQVTIELEMHASNARLHTNGFRSAEGVNGSLNSAKAISLGVAFSLLAI